MLINLFSFLVVFTIIALAHELGHFIWAKRAGIRVFEFGLGFGPRLFALTRSGTIFSINLIPILAFVRIAGEGESEEDSTCPDNEKFPAKTLSQKFKAIVAGPLMNIGVALFILAFLFLANGVPSGASNEIGSVSAGSPAELAGLQVGDRLVSINGHSYSKMDDAIKYIHSHANKRLILGVNRSGRSLTLAATPKLNPGLKIGLLGFSPKPLYTRINPLSALYEAFMQTVSMVVVTVFVLARLFTGGVSLSDLAGPVGIAQITGKYAQSGLVSLAFFTAFISVNIGVLNLLPLPALDGGRIVFLIIELVRKKPLPSAVENRINYWGMMALLTLMAVITINDILRVLRGGQ